MKLAELLQSPYYRDVYKALVGEMNTQGLTVCREDGPKIAKIGVHRRAGMSWEILGCMLGVNPSTLQQWAQDGRAKKKVSNGFRKW